MLSARGMLHSRSQDVPFSLHNLTRLKEFKAQNYKA
jgi:hypothetical protein